MRLAHGGRRDVDLDCIWAIDSLQKVIWDRLREEGCHGRVPEGALGVVWEPFLDLQGSKNDALKRFSDDFFWNSGQEWSFDRIFSIFSKDNSNFGLF